MDTTYRERPTVKGNYTKEDLIEYARWRKEDELNNLKKIQDWKDENDDKEYEEHEDYREPLCMEKEQWVDITLSTGGDADGFRVRIEDNEIVNGVYWWADWGVYEEVKLSDDELDLISQVYCPQFMFE